MFTLFATVDINSASDVTIFHSASKHVSVQACSLAQTITHNILSVFLNIVIPKKDQSVGGNVQKSLWKYYVISVYIILGIQ